MTDKRFKWLLIGSCLTAIIIAFIWRYPDISKATATRDKKLGEFVYIDHGGKIHASRKCSKLNFKGLKSDRIPIKDFGGIFKEDQEGDLTFCPYCVSDEDYKKLTE